MLPFGIIPDLDLAGSAVSLDITAPSRLVLYSDGISETANPAGQQLGETGVGELLARLPADAPLNQLLTELAAFHGEATFHDDMTLVEISVGGH
jgi:sigma-B regulation protein RsbU (phosphoserine phosphatase)